MKNLHLNLLLVLVLFAPATALNAATDPAQPIDSIAQDSSVSLWHVNLGLGSHTGGWFDMSAYCQFDVRKGAYVSVGGLLGLRKSPNMPNDFRPFLMNGHESYLMGDIAYGFHLPTNNRTFKSGFEGGLALCGREEVRFIPNRRPESNWFNDMFDSLRERYEVERETSIVVGLHLKYRMAWNLSEFVGVEVAFTSMVSPGFGYLGIQVGMNMGQLW